MRAHINNRHHQGSFISSEIPKTTKSNVFREIFIDVLLEAHGHSSLAAPRLFKITSRVILSADWTVH